MGYGYSDGYGAGTDHMANQVAETVGEGRYDHRRRLQEEAKAKAMAELGEIRGHTPAERVTLASVLAQQDERINAIRERLEELSKRLEPVLGPETSKSPGIPIDGSPHSAAVVLVQKHNCRLEEIDYILANLNAELEV